MKRKYIVVACFILIIIPTLYWIKWELGLDFSEVYSLSNYPPFSYLPRNDTIKSAGPAMLLEDSFEPFRLKNKWHGLYSEDKDNVIRGYDTNGIGNSRCLLVRSASKKEWSCSHNRYVEVKKGDVFHYSVFVRLQGEKIRASAGADTFDSNKKVIKWGYVTQKVDENGPWIRIDKTFMIDDDVNYIRFRLSGVGVGEYRFDDVKFEKISGTRDE